MDQLTLLPRPRSLSTQDQQRALPPDRLIVLDSPEPGQLLFTAKRLRSALHTYGGVDWRISASITAPETEVGVVLRQAATITDGSTDHEQGYQLLIGPSAITIDAATPQGVFYGVGTLIQILEQSGDQLPCLTISDRPDFAARGVMLDISRDKVPTMETVYQLVDQLASWKLNQLQLYTEHTFAYRNHPDVWADATPFTGEEILELDAYCRERFVELVPNQNAFGHMHRWLDHKEYADLAETHDEISTPWGIKIRGPFSLSPAEPGSLELVSSLFDELLPHFSSRQFNVGCDETIDLGQGKSKELVAEHGEGRVYLDFLLSLYREVSARGRTMQFWGDIIEKHPELIPELPKDVVANAWGYEASHPFDELCAKYAAADVPFYVCPGTSSWCSIAGRTTNALGNLRNAAENGLANGAVGYLITDWGDRGHWQVFPVSYLGYVAGAAYSWAYEANQDIDVAEALSWHAFRDRTGVMGTVAYDLGEIYRTPGIEPPNASVLFWILQQASADDMPGMLELFNRMIGQLSADKVRETLEAIDIAVAPLTEARSEAPDAALLHDEFLNTARLLRHACRLALLMVGAESDSTAVRRELATDLETFIPEYERIWLERNRSGGLFDSAHRFHQLLGSYRAAL